MNTAAQYRYAIAVSEEARLKVQLGNAQRQRAALEDVMEELISEVGQRTYNLLDGTSVHVWQVDRHAPLSIRIDRYGKTEAAPTTASRTTHPISELGPDSERTKDRLPTNESANPG